MLRRMLARLFRSQRFQAFVANVSAPGAAPTLVKPEAPIFQEGASAEQRLREVEAERDALVLQLAALRQRIRELEGQSRASRADG